MISKSNDLTDQMLVDLLIQSRWSFGIIGQTPITNSFYFSKSGQIQGYQHSNERSWSVNNGVLTIFNEIGDPKWVSDVIFNNEGRLEITLRPPNSSTGDFILIKNSYRSNHALPSSCDFLFPKDLQITPTKISNILLIGTCLTGRYFDKLSTVKPDVKFEFFPFNFGSSLPEELPIDISDYNFQYIQLALPSVLTHRIVHACNFNNSTFVNEIMSDAYNVITLMLQAALQYNLKYGLLSFVANFFVPQMSTAPYLSGRYSNVDLSHIVRQLNDYLAFEILKFNNVFLADVNALGDSFGKRFFLDDTIEFFSHNGLLYQSPADLAEGARIEPVPEIGAFYDEKVDEFIDVIYDQMVSLYRVVNQIDQVKAVIFDLDNTLWRGQIAEDFRPDKADWPAPNGWPMAIWETIHHLRARGILVAICSKNDHSFVVENWNSPLGVGWLSLEDFVSVKINWNSKSDNILEICSEFNIKPKSVVFVDDNPIERAEVKSAIPDIRVIGSNPYLTKRILLWSSETQITFLSDESSRREEMIRSQIVRENQRITLKKEDFLATLNTKLRLVEVVDVSQPEFSRALELTNKTNQFNTTGVRWNSEAVLKFLRDDGHIYAFSVKDKFADYGLVGVIYQKKEKILQFVMSCRVMGMDIEYAALLRVISKVRNEIGEGPIYADLIFTKENTPSRNLFSQCNFVAINENETVKNYCLHYQQETAFPGHIEIVD